MNASGTCARLLSPASLAQWLNVHVDFPLLQRIALPINRLGPISGPKPQTALDNMDFSERHESTSFAVGQMENGAQVPPRVRPPCRKGLQPSLDVAQHPQERGVGR